jgi:hypothetical protein
MAMSVMPSPRCSFNVNDALSLVPTTSKPEAAFVCGFEGGGVTGRGTGTDGFGGVTAGVVADVVADVVGLLLTDVLDLSEDLTVDRVFGLVLIASLDLVADLAAGRD